MLQPFCSLVQIHGHNRARQRDKLGHILEEFATLQDEVRARHLSVKFIKTQVTSVGSSVGVHAYSRRTGQCATQKERELRPSRLTQDTIFIL